MIDSMTVKELIEYLKTKPQDILVVYCCHSERCLIEEDEIKVMELCEPRPDGWVQNARSDMPKQKYLVLPGN